MSRLRGVRSPSNEHLDRVRDRYRRFANSWYRDYSNLYYDLSLAASSDKEVLQFLAEQREGLQPNLLFAAIQYMTGVSGMPASGPELARLIRRRGAYLSRTMLVHRNQTNEVARCALFVPALPPGPLALVEVGASAGLCLLLDQFAYSYHDVSCGGDGAPLRLACSVSGRCPIPVSLPEVTWRRGLDLHPVDVRDKDAIRWLDACVWSDHPYRRSRLHAAVDAARSKTPAVDRGDLVDALPTVIAAAPQNVQLVVFHSATLTYVSNERRLLFMRVLSDASRQRRIILLSNEVVGVMGAAPAPHHISAPAVRFLLQRTTFEDGEATRELLAVTHPHGLEMHWLAESLQRRRLV